MSKERRNLGFGIATFGSIVFLTLVGCTSPAETVKPTSTLILETATPKPIEAVASPTLTPTESIVTSEPQATPALARTSTPTPTSKPEETPTPTLPRTSTPTPTPKPEETPTPTPEPTPIPNSEIMEGLLVIGPPDFRQRTKDSLNVLRATEWLKFVTQRLKQIILIERDSRVDLLTGIFRVTRLVAFANDDVGAIKDSIDWYACALVHEAQHIEQFRTGKPSFGAQAELDAHAVQIKCLEAIGAPQRFINDIKNTDACIMAGGCNYWDQPHEY